MGWVSSASDGVLSVIRQGDTVVAVGTSNNLYILAGSSRQVVSGKPRNIPAGIALHLFTGKLNRFSIKEFIFCHKQKFKELLSDDIIKASAVQEQLFKQQKIEVPKQEVY